MKRFQKPIAGKFWTLVSEGAKGASSATPGRIPGVAHKSMPLCSLQSLPPPAPPPVPNMLDGMEAPPTKKHDCGGEVSREAAHTSPRSEKKQRLLDRDSMRTGLRKSVPCTQDLGRASAAVAAAACSVSRSPERARRVSLSTRSHGAASGCQLLHASERRARQKARARVKCFAQSLVDLPAVDAGAVRIADHVTLKDPDVTWVLHRSVGARLEHSDILSKLMTAAAADDDIVVSVPRYASEKTRRCNGKAHPAWQMAESGAVTLPHVDVDVNGVGINTYFIITRGAELIVAWRRKDLHECDALREIPTLGALHRTPSLTILRAVKGDVIFMPADTVHMVITEKTKCHLTFHTYPEPRVR